MTMPPIALCSASGLSTFTGDDLGPRAGCLTPSAAPTMRRAGSPTFGGEGSTAGIPDGVGGEDEVPLGLESERDELMSELSVGWDGIDGSVGDGPRPGSKLLFEFEGGELPFFHAGGLAPPEEGFALSARLWVCAGGPLGMEMDCLLFGPPRRLLTV